MYQLYYDDVKSNSPIYKDFLTISTEVRTVDFQYAKDIVLGSIKANVVITKTYPLLNKGDHEVSFQ